FFIAQIALLYDLHFKQRGVIKRARQLHKPHNHSFFLYLRKVAATATLDRSAHLKWSSLKLWVNYLILPGIIFWGSICIFFVNFGFPKIQQVFVALSSAAFFLNYLYLKEIFRRGKELIDRDIFVILTTVKIYASALVYSAAIALVKSYCLSGWYLVLSILALTFLLIYQALFQHRLVTGKNLAITLLIAGTMSVLGYGMLVWWGYNYFTAAVFLTACYNLLWGIFHYHLDRALTWQAFWEILVISVIVAAMLFSVTNFKARLLNECEYNLPV